MEFNRSPVAESRAGGSGGTGAPRAAAEESATHRPTVRGKFIHVGRDKLHVCGVTYGTFAPRPDGTPFPERDIVARDFARMRANHINCVRVYDVPPLWLLDCALANGLRVMVGIPWEHHILFLDDRKLVKAITARASRSVRALNRHPAILMYAIGNEIPPAIVRWYGRRRVERFLKTLCALVKREDPDGLVTYVNFPTTEYLQLPFLDVQCFNVYLEDRAAFEAYLARLQNLADEKPVVIAEMGLDSRRHGESVQSTILQWQLKSAFAGGSAGAFVFAWTDEWFRGGEEINDWAFGLTTRRRLPKPALAAVRESFSHVPFDGDSAWPRVSVFVCSHNGARTIGRTLAALAQLDYPDYEIVVVDDGSQDNVAQIAGEYNVRLIRTENRGLSAARNEALKDEAAGIVAFIDDDAYPDPHWLKFLVHTMTTTDYVAVGGPNCLPPESGFISNCVGNAPGGPAHVLISNTEAEHIPGCNMAYRKEALKAIGGFDAQFRIAGDDIDVCWRLRKRGWNIGFHPTALVWHQRRDTLRTYLRQQYNYGKAEAMLERKWPHKYNSGGHIPWRGKLYGHGQTVPLLAGRWQVYQGVRGSAPFQSLYQPAKGVLAEFPLMPEYFLFVVFLGIMTLAGFSWEPLLGVAPSLVLAVSVSFIQAWISARRAEYTFKRISPVMQLQLWAVTAALHLLQPLARLAGRLKLGLSPWKCHGIRQFLVPRGALTSFWSETWRSSQEWLDLVVAELKKQHLPINHGGNFDNWDLEVRGGLLGTTRLLLAVEEHGRGKQMLRFRVTPDYKVRRTWVIGVFILCAALAGLDGKWFAMAILGGTAATLLLKVVQNCAYSEMAVLQALSGVKARGVDP